MKLKLKTKEQLMAEGWAKSEYLDEPTLFYKKNLGRLCIIEEMLSFLDTEIEVKPDRDMTDHFNHDGRWSWHRSCFANPPAGEDSLPVTINARFYCANGNENEPELWYKDLDDCAGNNPGTKILSLDVAITVLERT